MVNNGGVSYIERKELSENKGRERRATLEAWKSGVILPPPVLGPAYLGDTISDVPLVQGDGMPERSTSNPSRRGNEQRSRSDYDHQTSFRDVAFANIEDVMENGLGRNGRSSTVRALEHERDPGRTWLEGEDNEKVKREDLESRTNEANCLESVETPIVPPTSRTISPVDDSDESNLLNDTISLPGSTSPPT
jgi:hypothetical protein